MPDSEQHPYATASETHTGVVLTLGERAYKLKKPVRLSALDFRSRDARLAICRREVELNSRLAPDVYLGVADVHGPDGELCDHMVVMRRLPVERSLASMVDAGSAGSEHVRVIAAMMAGFHAGAARSAEIDEQAATEALERRWNSILDQVGEFTGTGVDAGMLSEIADRARKFVAGRRELFDRRIADGRVVDGHGDLLASDVFVLEDGPRALDCLEFDDRLRYLDEVDDMAALAMDLEHRGAAELSRLLAEQYRELADDPVPESLWHHYIAYRALVRVMTSCARADQLGDSTKAASLREEAGALAELSREHLRKATPALVLVGGSPGTGKSTVSDGLAGEIGASVISSDRVRKELAGMAPAETPDGRTHDEVYSDEHTWRTYNSMVEQAQALLCQGETVILDASWTNERHRELAAEMAANTYSVLVPLQCAVPDDVAVQRVRGRAATISDADEGVAASMAAHADPWPDAHEIDTGTTLRDSVQAALAAVRKEGDRVRVP